MSKALTKYEEIMNRYHAGEFGEDNLTLREILEKAGEPNLLKELTKEDKEYLSNKSYGMMKMLFKN